MKRLLTLATLVCLASVSFAQLSHQQMQYDFRQLVGMYDKHYAPYGWKVDAFNYDLLRMQPWFAQVNSAPDDLAFYDICVRYVASLQDSHDSFTLPSSYEAYIPITVDIYDGRVLIDYIDRTALPSQQFPFAIGDELLSVDGVSTADWIARLGVYSVNGQANPVTRDRIAVAAMIDRYQGFYTYASGIHDGDKATVVVRSQNGTASYSIPWVTIAIPFTQQGPVPNPGGKPFLGKTAFSESPVRRPMKEIGRAETNEWGLWTGEEPAHELSVVPKELERLQSAQDFSALMPEHVIAGGLAPFNSKFPKFNPPPGFHLRLGGKSTDEFVTGTFPAGSKTVGFIRIPSFSPASQSNALAQFRGEIAFFQQNTSGLVIDLMGNGGGNICYTNVLIQSLSPQPFQALPSKLRATENWLLIFENFLVSLQFNHGSQADMDFTSGIIDQIQVALAQNRGNTDPLNVFAPLFCNAAGGAVYPPLTDKNGNNLAYTRPILLLTDSFSISAAEFFSAVLQDMNRVSVYGTRTDGGGGNVVSYNNAMGAYAEGSIRMTQSLAVRNHDISTPGLPSAPYIENIGIQPDFPADYQTKTNLLTGGQPFVAGFVSVIGGLIGN